VNSFNNAIFYMTPKEQAKKIEEIYNEAKTPAVKRSESPGKKKPKNKPVSAKTIRMIPIIPTALIITIGSSIPIILN